MLTEEQVAERVNYLGGSDIPAVLGMSRFKTALQVWGEKTGAIIPEDISDKLQVRLGNKLEAVVAEIFEEETGKKLHRVNDVIIHQNYNFLRAHIDRRVVGEKSIVEIKTTSPWRIKEFEGYELPADYILQTVFYMALSGADIGYVAVLLGNQSFKIKTIHKDRKLEADIISKSVSFWKNYVEPKVMPETVTAKDGDTLYKLFPLDDQTEIELTDEANKLCESIGAMVADSKSLGAQIDKSKNELRIMLGKHSVGKTATYKVSWLAQEKKEYVVPSSKTRVLRVSKIKEKK